MASLNGDTITAQLNGHTNGGTNDDSTSKALPVVIAGGGCVGLFLSLLLAHSSITNHIIVLEPDYPDPTCTRAMAHQPPTYPIFSKVPGLLPELVAEGSLSSGLCFRTSVAHGSKVLAEKRFDNSGEGMKGKGQLLLPQGKFQRVLLRRLEKLGDKVSVQLGSRVVEFTQNSNTEGHGAGRRTKIGEGRVRVKIQGKNGTEEYIDAEFLVGADGAHSTVRKQLGVELKGETLDAQLVATDLYYDFHAHGFHDANFIIDPLEYGLIGRISKPKSPDEPALWRVSYGVPLGVSEDTIREQVDKKLAHMLPNGGRGPAGEKSYRIQRIAPYKAQQRCVSSFVHDHAILVGDAAHLTNPYAGLGLASGMADASSLSEVLIRILSGDAKDSKMLLDKWSCDRVKKFEEVIDQPSRMAYKRVKSDVSSEEKVQELMLRDPMVGALKRGMPVMPPSLETKVGELEGW